MKILRVNKGFHIPGGQQMFGKFKSLKHCMRICTATPTCLSGDYNPWLHKCYQHTSFSACNTVRSHKHYIHFSKVPCCERRCFCFTYFPPVFCFDRIVLAYVRVYIMFLYYTVGLCISVLKYFYSEFSTLFTHIFAGQM